jgi:hypothetical protein
MAMQFGEIQKLLGSDAASLSSTGPAPSRPLPSTCPGRTSSTRSSCRATARPASWRACAHVRRRPPRRHRLLSILPVDQGIEHSAGASFAPNPACSTRRTSSSSAIEGGCNAVASTFGVLAIVRAPLRAQDPVHRQAQPQRVPLVPEHLRPDDVRQREDRVRDGRGRRRRDRLLGLARVAPPAPRGRARRSSRRTTSACSRCCGATCATPASRPRRRTTRPRPI